MDESAGFLIFENVENFLFFSKKANILKQK